MKKIIFAFCLLLTIAVSGQNEKDFNLDFYGFIRNEFYIDTYKGIDGAVEQYYLLPIYAGQDANGEDINEQTSANMQALASRLGVNISGPEIFGAKSSANMEFDFGGIVSTEPTLFRIRKAYAKLDWEKSSILMGQTWHPFWSGDIFPTVGSLNTGAPFQPFNRSPQLRYDYKAGKLKLTGAAVYQLQYTSPAFNSSHQSSPSQAKRNGVLPEMIGNVEFRSGAVALGAGVSHNLTKPKMTITNEAGQTFKADETLASLSYIGYLQYKKDKLKIQLKGVLGQNTKHLLMPGGYGVATYNGASGEETYTNYNNMTTYLNLVYGKKWQIGLFAGYGKNLGTDSELANIDGAPMITGIFNSYTKGIAQSMNRIAPSIALNVSKLRMVLEFEQTTAYYGSAGIGGNFDFKTGLFDTTHKTTNNRLVFMMMYFF